MDTETKVVIHTNMRMNIDIFSNCRYENENYSTLLILYKLSYLFFARIAEEMNLPIPSSNDAYKNK
jgi:hypothetical protein